MATNGEPMQLIVAAGPASLGTLRERVLEPLARAWPGGSLPEQVATIGLSTLLDLLETSSRATEPADISGVLVVFDDNTPPHVVDVITEALRACYLPAVVLCENPAPWRTFQHSGILFEARATSAESLAAALHALMHRQQEVARLLAETRLSQRCEGTIRRELDRVHEELQVAASIQREFTRPALASLSGVCAQLLCRPVNFVSGDMLWVRETDGRYITFFLGDAAGHGVPAALLTMTLAHALDTAIVNPAVDGHSLHRNPARMLAHLNTCVCTHGRGIGWFATAVCGVLDSFTGELLVAGAGHPPPLIFAARPGMAALVSEIMTDGPVLGISADACYTETCAHLGPRDVLCLYTDGLEDVFPCAIDDASMRDRERPHLRYLEQLGDALNSAVGFACTEDDCVGRMSKMLEGLIDGQSGSLHPTDDMTALFLQRRSDQASKRVAA